MVLHHQMHLYSGHIYESSEFEGDSLALGGGLCTSLLQCLFIPSPTPSLTHPSLYCTLQGTVDSMVLSDGGKGEDN